MAQRVFKNIGGTKQKCKRRNFNSGSLMITEWIPSLLCNNKTGHGTPYLDEFIGSEFIFQQTI